jgi:hypothetical protein
MEWNPTWEDPLTSYVKRFDGLMGDKRTRQTFGETVKGIIGLITFFRTIFPAKPSQGKNWSESFPLSRKDSLSVPSEAVSLTSSIGTC